MRRSVGGQAQAFGRAVPWQSGAHKILFGLCNACLSLYLSYVLFLADSLLLMDGVKTAYCLLWWLAFAGMLYLGFCFAFRRMSRGLLWVTGIKKKLSLGFFCCCMGLGLLILGCSFAASYPGGISYDVYNQWMQAKTGMYNSWHPVFHTLLMGLGRLLLAEYPRVVMLQIVFFSGTMAYLMATLSAWQMPKAVLLVLQGLVMASSIVCHSLTYLWKDNAMTMGALLLCVYAVNIYFTKGEWLSQWRNALALGLVLAFTTLVRHNAMFFTSPLMVCLLLAYFAQWKRLLLAVGAFALSVLLVLGPVYGALDIVKPNNTYEECIGLPMTVLFDTRVQNPQALDSETASFLEDLASDETVAAEYRPGDYNTIKFAYPREKITSIPPAKLLSMVAATVRRNPQGAFETVNAVTDLVWDVTGKNEGIVAVKNAGYLEDYPAQNTRLNDLGRTLQDLLHVPLDIAPVRWLFENIGVQMALLLMAALWALYRNGPRALAFAVPILVYNLGTMLLLCGSDVRFFQFSMVVSLPSLLVLCQRQPGPGISQSSSKEG